jgi:hypothetical protein
VCGAKNFVSVRLYSAPQSHWTIAAILGICAYGLRDQAEFVAKIKQIQSAMGPRKPPGRAWHQFAGLVHTCSEGMSGGLTGALIKPDAREGWLILESYLAARSNKRLLVNSSALSARLRQRAACSPFTSPKRN